MRVNKPYLQFDFNKQSFCFTEPLEIFIAQTIAEVEPCFRAIERYLAQGYYAAGYLAYEAAPAFDPTFKVNKGKIPLMWFGIFKAPHQETKEVLGTFQLENWQADTDEKAYRQAIEKIKQAIARGETYQLNYTMQLQNTFSGDDYAFYQALKRRQQASYAAYLNLGDLRFLSVSPELFFSLNNGQILTKPMKGTSPRGRYLQEDLKQAGALTRSEKNRAENVMIVDLLRNDLGRIAKPGTVQVKSLFDLETYPSFHTLTSTIAAELKPNTRLFEIFSALFPCGSVTGAPKIKTMEHIACLETGPREAYCGAIGYIGPEQGAFNVAIRTVQIDKKTSKARYGVGGGITWDSVSKAEYSEAALKAKVLDPQPKFDLIETLRLEEGEFLRLQGHVQRLQESARYFQRPFPKSKLDHNLVQYAKRYEKGVFRVRLRLTEEGSFSIESWPYVPVEASVKIRLAKKAISKEDIFLFHKTSHRKVYEEHKNQAEDVFDVLLWNEHEELTEFTMGNLVLEIAGQKLTPPKEAGLLRGVLSQSLLDAGELKEASLRVSDLQKAERIWFINSLRGQLLCDLVL